MSIDQEQSAGITEKSVATQKRGYFKNPRRPGMKRCPRCGEWKRRPKFATDRSQKDGKKVYCRECASAIRMTSRTDPFKAHDYTHLLMSRASECYKPSAILIVAAAKVAGWLRQPGQCEQCGRERDLHAHHPDYSLPLHVVWLCPQCHMRVPRAKRRGDCGPCEGSCCSRGPRRGRVVERYTDHRDSAATAVTHCGRY